MTDTRAKITLPQSGLLSTGFITGSLLALAAGFFSLLGPMFRENFATIPGDFGDARLVNLLLEHNYAIFFQLANKSFWSPEWMFFPLRETLAMSEPMSGSAWLYGLFRVLGLDFQSAFQGWIVGCCALNFGCCLWLFRSSGLGRIAAIAGAWVFAFAMPRAGFLNHPQLLPGFYSPLALLMLLNFFRCEREKSALYSLTGFSIFAALQIWACVYLGWFLGFMLALAGLWCLGRQSTRAIFIKKLLLHWKSVAVSLVLFTAFVTPLAVKLLQTSAKYGARGWMDITMYLPEFYLFLLPHENSLLYGWLFDITPHNVKYLYEKLIFPGFLVFFSSFILLVSYRKNREKIANATHVNRVLMWLAPVTVLTIFVLIAKIKNTESLWRIPYTIFPGTGGLRAAGRIILLNLLPMGFSFAVLFDYLLKKISRTHLRTVAGVAILVLVILENWVLENVSYKKTDHLKKITPLVTWLEDNRAQCDAFYYYSATPTSITQVDAMWASFLTSVPTLNGHSGVSPIPYKKAGLDDALPTSETLAKEWLNLNLAPQDAAHIKLCLLDKADLG